MAAFRYIVHHHTGVAEPHYDLMLEVSPTADLLTWRLSVWPIVNEQIATRLKDHRRIYLDYTGPVSGGRGELATVEAGVYAGEVSDHVCTIHLGEAPNEKQFQLIRITNDNWRVVPLLKNHKVTRASGQCERCGASKKG